MDISGISSNAGKAGAKLRLKCSWISLTSIYLIKMWVRHPGKLDSDVHVYL